MNVYSAGVIPLPWHSKIIVKVNIDTEAKFNDWIQNFIALLALMCWKISPEQFRYARFLYSLST